MRHEARHPGGGGDAVEEPAREPAVQRADHALVLAHGVPVRAVPQPEPTLPGPSGSTVGWNPSAASRSSIARSGGPPIPLASSRPISRPARSTSRSRAGVAGIDRASQRASSGRPRARPPVAGRRKRSPTRRAGARAGAEPAADDEAAVEQANEVGRERRSDACPTASRARRWWPTRRARRTAEKPPAGGLGEEFVRRHGFSHVP